MKRLTADRVKVGFIGLGNMGGRIAQRLLNHGYQLSVYDRDLAKAKAIAAQGGAVATSIVELAGTVDVLEMSTISPESSRELHSLGAEGSVEVLDVAISGSTPAAEKGILTLLVGGDEELFHAAAPIFQAIAKQCFLLGGPGSGTAMKLVVNTLLGVGMQAIAEAVVLGEKAGLERPRLLEVLAQTAVIAPAHVGKLAKVALNDYSPQFPLSLMNKDFQLILEAAAQERISMPTTEAAFYVNSDELVNGDEEDFSAVLRRMEEVAGIADVHSAR